MAQTMGPGDTVDSPRAWSAAWPRHAGQLLAFLVLWPALAVHHAPAILAATPLFDGVPPRALRWGMAAGAAELWREHLAVGLLLAAAAALAARLGGGAAERGRARQLLAGLVDALLVASALHAGIALELPAVLRHPALSALGPLPVWAGCVALLAAALAIAAGAGWRRRTPWRHLAAALLLVGAGFTLAQPPRPFRGQAQRDVRLVLGLDSLSRAEVGEALGQLAARRGGSAYARAVSPGLLTNAVWAAIATSHRPSEIGVFFTFQSPDWSGMPPNLVDRAREAGLHTVAFFGDQFTMHLGADLAFDEDRSGPRGWLQVATAAVKDAGLFLPVLLPRLPPIPGAAAPANQEGTYAFSLRRELDEVLGSGRAGRGSLVLAHVDYLHQPRYPGLSELTGAERGRVLRARVASISDNSIHWQYPETADAPIDVYRWKVARLLQVLSDALSASGILEPSRGNALVLFSDHGPRGGIEPTEFARESYYGVPLVTFGLPVRDLAAPISLIDVAALVGLASPARPGPAQPVVEYVNVTHDEWAQLLRRGVPLRDGRIRLPTDLLARVGTRLLVHRPYAGGPLYAPAPTVPAAERAAPVAGRGAYRAGEAGDSVASGDAGVGGARR